MTDMQTFLIAIGVGLVAMLVGIIFSKLDTRYGNRFWIVALAIFGAAAFIDSVFASLEDDFDKATYRLIIALVIGYFIKGEVRELRRNRKKATMQEIKYLMLKNVPNDFGMQVQVKQDIETLDIHIRVRDDNAECNMTVPRDMARYQDSFIATMEEQMLKLRRKKAEQRG